MPVMFESLNLRVPSPLTQIKDDLLEQKRVQLFIKRDDLIHPDIQGNKWRKLKYNLIKAKSRNYETLLSFGGAYSNHIHATAAAGHLLGFNTIGLIRGEETLPLNPTLQDAVNWGMQIHYLNRTEYRTKNTTEFIHQLKQKYGNFYLIPEGGSNLDALTGCREIIDELDTDYDVICCACGTGATLAGLISGLNNRTKAIGFQILQGANYITEEVNKFLADIEFTTHIDWHINAQYTFGGYARISQQLMEFIQKFHITHNIQLDPVYTGKMLFGLYDLIRQNHFNPGTKIIAIHTGGIQGLRGFNFTQQTAKQMEL